MQYYIGLSDQHLPGPVLSVMDVYVMYVYIQHIYMFECYWKLLFGILRVISISRWVSVGNEKQFLLQNLDRYTHIYIYKKKHRNPLNCFEQYSQRFFRIHIVSIYFIHFFGYSIVDFVEKEHMNSVCSVHGWNLEHRKRG